MFIIISNSILALALKWRTHGFICRDSLPKGENNVQRLHGLHTEISIQIFTPTVTIQYSHFIAYLTDTCKINNIWYRAGLSSKSSCIRGRCIYSFLNHMVPKDSDTISIHKQYVISSFCMNSCQMHDA